MCTPQHGGDKLARAIMGMDDLDLSFEADSCDSNEFPEGRAPLEIEGIIVVQSSSQIHVISGPKPQGQQPALHPEGPQVVNERQDGIPTPSAGG